MQRLANVQPHRKVRTNTSIFFRFLTLHRCYYVTFVFLVFEEISNVESDFIQLLYFLIFILEQRSQSQQNEPIKDDVCVQISLPPSVEGRVYAILICHIPKLRWLTKYQSICRSVTIKVTWWGEDDTSAIFK